MVTPESHARRAWARALIKRASTPVVAYGSPEWVALPDGPEKVAAVVAAAEKWAMDGDVAELEQAAHARWLDGLRRDADEHHRAAWEGRAFRPDPAIAAEVEREYQEWIRGDVA